MRPILVIGASIAGLVYATNVARRGLPVHVFERKSDLAKEPSVAQVAYDHLLQDGPRIRMADVAHSVRETHLHGPHGATLRLGAPAYILDRRRWIPPGRREQPTQGRSCTSV